jgi:hypothetical protein
LTPNLLKRVQDSPAAGLLEPLERPIDHLTAGCRAAREPAGANPARSVLRQGARLSAL